ncbi:GNAT family N-acetyltransferase [Nonomuraea indica]|uniref:GNAT family N-acetyltransferase n=1 Tax=Nonomuraea indica TaxID=1581193 RepID=UPI000C7E1BC7|nr:GNAT family N-acetyltransferase [Nonomuraea indica]
MASDFTIRRAGPADSVVVGDIHATTWLAAYARFFDPEFCARAAEQRRTRWHRVLAETTDTVLLASAGERPLAFSRFGASPRRPGAAEIVGFYNHPDGWGTGIAGALMTATLAALRDEGYGLAHLWTLRDTPQARRFYAKCGLTESGERRVDDYGGTAIDEVEYEIRL